MCRITFFFLFIRKLSCVHKVGFSVVEGGVVHMEEVLDLAFARLAAEGLWTATT